jgi:hypothetical protein
MLRRALLLGHVAASPVLTASQTDPKTLAAVQLASKYVENYRKEFSAIVCEERQIQTLIKPDGRIRKTRVLVSDLMFVTVGADAKPSAFRDVISVDGKPVRDRDNRLRKLFLEKPSAAAADQALKISVESTRYDLGIRRVGESPLIPIGLLDSPLLSNFRFVLTGRTLTFDEAKSPTYMRAMLNGRLQYAPSRGSFVIDPEIGAVLSATLTSEGSGDDPMSRTFVARYGEHAALKILVPIEMTESYRYPAQPKADRFEAKYTYSAFRRFTVTTSEIIK